MAMMFSLGSFPWMVYCLCSSCGLGSWVSMVAYAWAVGRDHGLSLFCSGCWLVLCGWFDCGLYFGFGFGLSIPYVGLINLVGMPVGIWLLLCRAVALFLCL